MLEGAVLEERRVEVALPVVPQALGVVLELGDRDVGAAQGALGVAGVELGGKADVLHDLAGDTELGEHRVADALELGELQDHRDHALGQRVGELLVDPHRHLRRVGRAGERVEDLTRADALRVGEVEGFAVEVGLVGDVGHRGGHVVDRHDVRPAELRADQRHPLGQRVAELLDRLEEVVGTVDLVHLAGLRVADDHGGAVDAPRDLGVLAHERLGLVLRAVVGGRELLALGEHVLAEEALVEPGDGDRGGVVQVADLERVGQGDRVARARDVHLLVDLVGGGHVVDRREVEEVLDLPLVGVEPAGVDAELVQAEVADDLLDTRLRTGVGHLPAEHELVEPVL